MVVCFRFLPIILFLFCCCSRQVERPVTEFKKGENPTFPEWACHQQYSIGLDSSSGISFLRIEAFPEKRYPGIEMPWLQGDWTDYKSLEILARMWNTGSTRFTLSVWDGKGKYEQSNRFVKSFYVDTGWGRCSLPLENGLVAANGRRINCGYIQRVVFSTAQRGKPTTFDIQRISLRKK
jgi:hypothetical protein